MESTMESNLDGERGAMTGRRVGRRALLTGMAASAVVAALDTRPGRAADAPVSAAGKAASPTTGKWRGVNLGNWLVLEKWMGDAAFKGVEAGDEFTLSDKLGKKDATTRLRAHRESWITEEDFTWLSARGINAVRIPVGYWVLDGTGPFVAGADTLDWAFQTAKKHGIGVLVDLHGAPGSQNAWDHSGRAGTLGWHTSKDNVAKTLDVIERLSERYGKEENLIGIELLNEPRWDVPIEILKSYYTDGYARVRKHIPAERGAVVIHDGFRPDQWNGFLPPADFGNVVLDTHIYQCYTDADHKKNVSEHIVAAAERKNHLDTMEKQGLPIIVGEWSGALAGESFGGLSPFEQEMGKRGYQAAQLTSYDRKRGWFFWSYKGRYADWSFRESVEHGWLPMSFQDTTV